MLNDPIARAFRRVHGAYPLDRTKVHPTLIHTLPDIGSWFRHSTEGTGYVDQHNGQRFFVIFGHGVGLWFSLAD